MSKKRGIITCIAIFLLILIVIIALHITRFRPFIQAKAYIIYGNKQCILSGMTTKEYFDSDISKYDDHPLFVNPAVGHSNCELCYTRTTIDCHLCIECIEITGRCYWCGGLRRIQV